MHRPSPFYHPLEKLYQKDLQQKSDLSLAINGLKSIPKKVTSEGDVIAVLNHYIINQVNDALYHVCKYKFTLNSEYTVKSGCTDLCWKVDDDASGTHTIFEVLEFKVWRET